MAYGYRRRRMRRKGGVIATRYRRRRLATFTRAVVNRIAETKSICVDASGSLVQKTWSFTSFLPGIVQGTTSSTRIGHQIYVRRIDIMIRIEPSASHMATGGSVGSDFCRLVLYRNRQTNGSLPSYGILFNHDTYNSLRNVPNIRRVSILRDYMHSMQRLGLTDTGSPPVVSASGHTVFQWTIYPRRRIQYTSNAGDITSILSNDYGIGVSASSNNCCYFQVSYQVWFNDV